MNPQTIFSELEPKSQAALGLTHVEYIVNLPDVIPYIDARIAGQWHANDLDAMHAYSDLRRVILNQETPMTPTYPLTPSENAEINAMLKAACAELDKARLHDIDMLDCLSVENFNLGFKEAASAMFLAAALLAGQMASRL